MPSLYFILVYVALALLIGMCGRSYRFGFWGYFFGTILFTPIIGLLLLLAVDPGKHRNRAS